MWSLPLQLTQSSRKDVEGMEGWGLRVYDESLLTAVTLPAWLSSLSGNVD